MFRTTLGRGIFVTLMLLTAFAMVGCKPNTITVPDVMGRMQAQAESDIVAAGLTVGIVMEAYSATVPAGKIIGQDPRAGLSVAPGTVVNLTVSKGGPPVSIPNVSSLTQEAAQTALTGMGLTVTVLQQCSSTVAAGLVVNQDPEAAREMAPGSSVVLTVSTGPCPVPVPNVVGQTQAAASTSITGAGLAVGAVAQAYSLTVPSGSVISQSPVAGTSASPGSAVALTVSEGPQPVIVPDVVGMTQLAADAVITNALLTIGAATQIYSANVAAGSVVSQTPAAGTSVSPGSAVALVISEGVQPVVVPNVVGQTQTTATTAITGIGLSVGTVIEQYSAAVPKGQVISQNPEAGTSGAPGTPVNLWISNGPAPPEAAFRASPSTGKMPLTVQFTDTSTPGDAAISTWHWLFGDGAESTVQDTSHVYATVGSYDVSLEVTTSAGNDKKVKPNFITVTPPDAGDIQTIILPKYVPLEMVWCPSGSFQMGRYPGEQDSYVWEDPQHLVTFASGFWMGKYELTKRQWQAVMGTTPWSGKDHVLADLDSPAVYVSWNDAQSFITLVNGATGLTFRLPSEAEWEYACRATTTTRFYWGDDPSYTAVGNYAWYTGNCSNQQYAHLVGQKGANGWGLYDMSGNVFEWCLDTAHEDYIGAPTDGSAWIRTPDTRMGRGGSWGSGGVGCRSALIISNNPTEPRDDWGFRLVR